MYRSIERDENGRIIIHPDTAKKESNCFYLQKGGTLYFDLESGGYMTGGAIACLEAAKQENRNVNYNTNRAGMLLITPQMTPKEALDTINCGVFSQEISIKDRIKEAKENNEGLRKSAGDKAPDQIRFEHFVWVQGNDPLGKHMGIDLIKSFCHENSIDPLALLTYYGTAAKEAEDSIQNLKEELNKVGHIVRREDIEKIRAKTLEKYQLPDTINKGDVPMLKSFLVLSKDDRRVKEHKSPSQSLFSKVRAHLQQGG